MQATCSIVLLSRLVFLSPTFQQQQSLRKLDLVIYVCRVFMSLASLETSGCHLRAQRSVVLGNLASLVPSKGITAKERVV